jgi:hypothetical protein
VNALGWESAELYRALERLDPNEDEHWTSQGLPRLEAISSLVGRPLERAELIEARPGWNRARAHQKRAGEPQTAPEPSSVQEHHHHSMLVHHRKLEQLAKLRAEYAALGPFARFFPEPKLPHCPLQRRIAAENRMARWRQDHRRPRR